MLLTDCDLEFMRDTQAQAFPGTAIIYGVAGSVSDGMGGYEDVVAAVGTVPARLYPRRARSYTEGTGGAQILSLTTWHITMPYDTDIDASQRIGMEGRTWEIISVNTSEHWRTAIRCDVEAHNEQNRT